MQYWAETSSVFLWSGWDAVASMVDDVDVWTNERLGRTWTSYHGLILFLKASLWSAAVIMQLNFYIRQWFYGLGLGHKWRSALLCASEVISIQKTWMFFNLCWTCWGFVFQLSRFSIFVPQWNSKQLIEMQLCLSNFSNYVIISTEGNVALAAIQTLAWQVSRSARSIFSI